ncbi:AraC family transcriptional regulator [Clostridium sp. AM27-31LB]|nr:AraC family transcriptional regulator [Clostridium sp. AM27-31LB]
MIVRMSAGMEITMKQTDIINPFQPYMTLEMDGYSQINRTDYGISHFYEFTIHDEKKHCIKAVPDASIDLLFNIGENKVSTYISGTVFGVKKWELGTQDDCFGVRFQPGQGILPKDITMEMIVNDDIEIDGDIFGKNLTEKIALAKTMSERIEIFKKAYEDMVLGRNSLSDKEKINEYLVNRIGRTKGMITMRQLEDETNYSACYLRRIFKSFHGISPKQFAQYIRFQNLLMQADKEGVRYEQVALDCGYYDEPHMMKEFKKYSGVTLEQYRKMINTNKRVKN